MVLGLDIVVRVDHNIEVEPLTRNRPCGGTDIGRCRGVHEPTRHGVEGLVCRLCDRDSG